MLMAGKNGQGSAVCTHVPLGPVSGAGGGAAAFRMLPAVAVRQLTSRYASIIDANDQAPPSHGRPVQTGAGRLAAANHIGRREHDIPIVCPMSQVPAGHENRAAEADDGGAKGLGDDGASSTPAPVSIVCTPFALP
jgi:hypothetical protein